MDGSPVRTIKPRRALHPSGRIVAYHYGDPVKLTGGGWSSGALVKKPWPLRSNLDQLRVDLGEAVRAGLEHADLTKRRTEIRQDTSPERAFIFNGSLHHDAIMVEVSELGFVHGFDPDVDNHADDGWEPWQGTNGHHHVENQSRWE